MKKLSLILACVFSALAVIIAPSRFAAFNARASSPRYAQANSVSSYFYTEKDPTSSLFAVPYTYCVEILSEDGEWYRVKYAEDSGIYRALYGYCKKECFTPLSTRPQTIYLYKTVPVTFRSETSSPILPALGTVTLDAAFYGTCYSAGTAYSYVLCQGSFGYISGANDDYPLINNDMETEPIKPAVSQGVDNNSTIICAIVLAALAATAIVLLFVSVKKKKTD